MEQERYVIFITNTLLSDIWNFGSLTDLGIGAIPRRTPPARISDFSLCPNRLLRNIPRSFHFRHLVFIIPETVLTVWRRLWERFNIVFRKSKP
jgi:hypothetical protein